MVKYIAKKVFNKSYLLKIAYYLLAFNKHVLKPLFQLKSIYTNNYIYSQCRSQNEHYFTKKETSEGKSGCKLPVSMGWAVL